MDAGLIVVLVLAVGAALVSLSLWRWAAVQRDDARAAARQAGVALAAERAHSTFAIAAARATWEDAEDLLVQRHAGELMEERRIATHLEAMWRRAFKRARADAREARAAAHLALTFYGRALVARDEQHRIAVDLDKCFTNQRAVVTNLLAREEKALEQVEELQERIVELEREGSLSVVRAPRAIEEPRTVTASDEQRMRDAVAAGRVALVMPQSAARMVATALRAMLRSLDAHPAHADHAALLRRVLDQVEGRATPTEMVTVEPAPVVEAPPRVVREIAQEPAEEPAPVAPVKVPRAEVHGTTGGYQRGCRTIDGCPEHAAGRTSCREAMSEYQRAWRARRKAEATS